MQQFEIAFNSWACTVEFGKISDLRIYKLQNTLADVSVLGRRKVVSKSSPRNISLASRYTVVALISNLRMFSF